MLEQLIGEANKLFDWVTTQAGWSSPLGWFQILLLVLAVVGALVIIRNLIGSHSSGGGGGGSYSTGYQPKGPGGLPTSYYVGSKRLGSFSIKDEVYNFKVPSSTPNLSKLREPVNFDIEKAEKLFLMRPAQSGNQQAASMAPLEENKVVGASDDSRPAGPD